MRQSINYTLISMALAIFSMFFGAGNAIFPLILGMKTQGAFHWAFLGLLTTGIGGPLLGLVGSTLFYGKFTDFFAWTGKSFSSFIIITTLALLGPFGVLPRCVTVAYEATHSIFPSTPGWLFSGLFCASALFCCWKQRLVLPVLGKFLSPVLIASLLFIIYQGYQTEMPIIESTQSNWNAFTFGISTGYDTMDLIASIYFSSGIWRLISLQLEKKGSCSIKSIFRTTLISGTMGCFLLALIYFGLAGAAARFSPYLIDIPPQQLMTQLANITLGSTWGSVANLAIMLTCLTTVVSLTMTISHILCSEIFKGTFSYHQWLGLMMVITTIMSNFGFELIMMIIHPVVSICYPFIIAITLVNIYRKMSYRYSVS